MAIHKRVSRIKQILHCLKENELPVRMNTWDIISTLKQDVVIFLLSEARQRRSINSKEKSDSLIKV